MKETNIFKIPAIAEIVKPTNDIILYQEQVIAIAREVALFTEEEADSLRKAMGKKKPEEMKKNREKFIDGAIENKYKRTEAEAIFQVIEKYSEYSFNRSHSCAYGFITYYTAYLKAHYPEHFIAATINSKLFGDATKKEQTIQKMLKECKRLNIKVIPPDVNLSNTECSVEEKKVYLGLNIIKGLGEGFSRKIQAERNKEGQFTSVQEFCERLWKDKIEKNKVELLAKAGAFSSITGSKKGIVEALPTIEKLIKKEKKNNKLEGQLALFDIPKQEIDVEATEDFTSLEQLKLNREILGFYLDGHPLDGVQTKPGYLTTIEEIDQLLEEKPFEGPKDKRKLGIHLYIHHTKVITTKTGKEMAFAEAEDKDGEVMELTFFSTTWQRIKKETAEKGLSLEENCWLVAGELEEGKKLIVNELVLLTLKE